MTTKEMVRCKKCSYLTENEKGDWICKDCGESIYDIADDDCPLEEEY